MMGLIHPMAACLICGMFLALPARAESGRITFSGAIVVPTCSSQFEPPAGGAVGDRPHALKCGASRGGAGRSNYRLTVTELDAAQAARNPLLQYFVGSRGATQMAGARMLTRTYE
jgi:hypothetical protein